MGSEMCIRDRCQRCFAQSCLHASHIGADWHVGSFEQSSVGIPHVVGGAMVVDAVMSMVGVGLGDAVVEAVLPGWEVINAGGHAMEAHAVGGAKVGAALR